MTLPSYSPHFIHEDISSNLSLKFIEAESAFEEIIKKTGQVCIQDCEDGVVCGFDGDRVDVIELGDGFTIDTDDIEVVSELNG